MRLRVHVQTAAMSLTKVEHHNNLMRTAIQALGAVLGGARACIPTVWTRLSPSDRGGDEARHPNPADHPRRDQRDLA